MHIIVDNDGRQNVVIDDISTIIFNDVARNYRWSYVKIVIFNDDMSVFN